MRALLVHDVATDYVLRLIWVHVEDGGAGGGGIQVVSLYFLPNTFKRYAVVNAGNLANFGNC